MSQYFLHPRQKSHTSSPPKKPGFITTAKILIMLEQLELHPNLNQKVS